MIRSSIGSDALKAATVLGASSSSHRATKRIPAATISSTRETLPAPGRDTHAEGDEHSRRERVDDAPKARPQERAATACDEREPSKSQGGEQQSMHGERGEGRAELRQQAREEHRHLRVAEIAEHTLPVRTPRPWRARDVLTPDGGRDPQPDQIRSTG